MPDEERERQPDALASKLTAKLRVEISPMEVLNNLMRLHNRLTVPFSIHVAKKFKIGMNEWIFLTQIGHLGETASHELAEITGIRPMAVSRAIATLRAHGRVEQRVDPYNRRRKTLRLTEEGERLYALMGPSGDEVARYLIEALEIDEAFAFNRQILKITNRLDETDERGNSNFLERTRVKDE